MTLLTTARGYEFCDDYTRVVHSSWTVQNFCPLKYAKVNFNSSEVSLPSMMRKGVTKDRLGCQNRITTCDCFNRPLSRLQEYYFSYEGNILIPEEVTICQIGNQYILPVPVSLVPVSPNRCKVTSRAHEGFVATKDICNDYKDG